MLTQQISKLPADLIRMILYHLEWEQVMTFYWLRNRRNTPFYAKRIGTVCEDIHFWVILLKMRGFILPPAFPSLVRYLQDADKKIVTDIEVLNKLFKGYGRGKEFETITASVEVSIYDEHILLAFRSIQSQLEFLRHRRLTDIPYVFEMYLIESRIDNVPQRIDSLARSQPLTCTQFLQTVSHFQPIHNRAASPEVVRLLIEIENQRIKSFTHFLRKGDLVNIKFYDDYVEFFFADRELFYYNGECLYACKGPPNTKYCLPTVAAKFLKERGITNQIRFGKLYPTATLSLSLCHGYVDLQTGDPVYLPFE